MKEIIVDTNVENIQKVTDFINEQLECLECPMKVQIQLDIVIDELFGNIVHYAYAPGTGLATVQIEVQEEPKAVVITFMDQGIPYNPLEAKEPDITLSVEEREVGGLGIFMVKKSVDDISYEYKDGKNILQVKKYM